MKHYAARTARRVFDASLAASTVPPARNEKEAEGVEDDYMSMRFTDLPLMPSSDGRKRTETSLQRRQRLQREGEMRARILSKAELEAEEERRRKDILSTSLFYRHDRPGGEASNGADKSKGLKIMEKMGFQKGGVLGAAALATAETIKGEGQGERETLQERVLWSEAPCSEPIRIEVRDGREGIGLENERKRKSREAADRIDEAAKRIKVDERQYRDRMKRESESARLEKLVTAAQKVCERMAGGNDEHAERRGKSIHPIPIIWRGLVRARKEAERDRKRKHEVQAGLASASEFRPRGLLNYDDGSDEDADDGMSMGKTEDALADDLDDEDEELDRFNALEPEAKMSKLVAFLRREHRYCFWCKCQYGDEGMEGCPGVAELDHD